MSAADSDGKGVIIFSGYPYVKDGETVSITVQPAEGYRIKSVKANDIELLATEGNIYTTEIHADTVFAAEFESLLTSVPVIESVPKVFKSSEENCSITFGRIMPGNGYTVSDWGIVYSLAEDEASVKAGEHLSAKKKNLVSGAFGVKLIVASTLNSYYTTPYVTYLDGTKPVTIYGASVQVTK